VVNSKCGYVILCVAFLNGCDNVCECIRRRSVLQWDHASLKSIDGVFGSIDIFFGNRKTRSIFTKKICDA
jgi:hypothetical protein